MRRWIRFLIGLLVGLAILTVISSVIVQRTTGAWFERDLSLRARLAIGGARQALVSHWQTGSASSLRGLLVEITHDERIMAAAACTADLVEITRTPDFPEGIDCRELGEHIRPSLENPTGEWQDWNGVIDVGGRRVHVSAIPVIDQNEALGYVTLVQDLSFTHRREAATRNFLLAAFGFLAVAASAVTLIAARLSWRNWSAEVRSFLRGGAQKPEFMPILQDVRELVERIAAEREADDGGEWTADRLRNILDRSLHGEKVIVVANREPYVHELSGNGKGVTVLHPASGLVTALEPIMRACSGTWIAHGSGSADRATADRDGRIKVPPGEESYTVRRIWLSPEEEKGYYYGLANEGLWPLCHIAHTRPVFRSGDWSHYQSVNRRFADAVCDEVDSEDPIVFVQDYHFALAPRLIRERLPRATIIMFWHIPWPNAEQLGICPWRNEMLEGMLGASILGFHTQLQCNNFLDSVDRFLETRIDRESNAVIQSGRRTSVRPYPISLEWPSRWLDDLPPADVCRAGVLRELGLPPDARIGLGVDRLDYTKGLEERLLTVERLLERVPSLQGKFTFVQLAAPSRTAIERYRQLAASVQRIAARINARFSEGDYRPVILLHAHHEPPTVFRYYRAADVCYVSALHDGMNLVAKEFVASRDDERGVLVLSAFTGAARELTEALIVNPYDFEDASSALAAALEMSLDEQRDRMRAMRRFISEFNVYRWAGRMLMDAARLRRSDRLTGRLRPTDAVVSTP